MARSTGVDLVVRPRLSLPVHGSGVRIRGRPRPAGWLQVNGEAVRPVICVVRAFLVSLRPCHMVRTGPVARFAGDIDLRPRSRVAVLGKVVILAQVGGVAIGAHVVPVLVAPRPVQRIGTRYLLSGIEMEPALAVVLLAPRIPGHNEGLYSTVGKWDQILLQRRDTERIGEVVILRLAVGAVGADVKLAVFLEEAGTVAIAGKVRVVEISQDAGIVGHLHRLGVMGSTPG